MYMPQEYGQPLSLPRLRRDFVPLFEVGVCAALANEIDTAWLHAWQQVKRSPATLLDMLSNDQLADELLAAFRQALKARLDAPAPAPAATLYTGLMFQQLHMLKQFITPESN
jgi:hypothetical protein